MARPPATPEQRRAQRDRIFQAASAIYAAEGPSAVTVRAVAEAAGTSQGTIYSYFSSLGELLRALWAEPVAAASARLEQIAEATTDPVERVRLLLEGFADFVFANPEVHRGALLYVRPTAQPAPDRFPLTDLVFHRLLVTALQEARTDGTVTIDDPAATAELLWAALHGALALPINADIYEVSTSRDLATRMIDFLLAGIVAS